MTQRSAEGIHIQCVTSSLCGLPSLPPSKQLASMVGLSNMLITVLQDANHLLGGMVPLGVIVFLLLLCS